jgi:hypothetical protein
MPCRKEPDTAAVPATKPEPPDERRAYVAESLPLRGGPVETESVSASDYFVVPRSVLERWRRAAGDLG